MILSPFPRKPVVDPRMMKKQQMNIRLIPFHRKQQTHVRSHSSQFLFGGFEDAIPKRYDLPHLDTATVPATSQRNFQVSWDPPSDGPTPVRNEINHTGVKNILLDKFGLFVITAFSENGDVFFFCMVVNRSDERENAPIMVHPPSGQNFKTAFIFSDERKNKFPWSIRLSPDTNSIKTSYQCHIIHLKTSP